MANPLMTGIDATPHSQRLTTFVHEATYSPGHLNARSTILSFTALWVSAYMTPNRPTFIDAPEDRPRPTSRRIKITLPASLAEKLDKLADRAGESPAKVAARIIRQAIDNSDPDAAPPTRHSTARSDHQPDDNDGRAPWLEPYGGSREWRGLTWGAIVGLHGRYPEALSSLKEGWWRNDSHLETLSALAVWRQWIDDAGRDPREELAFQAQLANYGHVLRQAGGSIIDKWQPGAPPADW
jgi:hypothetical protein